MSPSRVFAVLCLSLLFTTGPAFARRNPEPALPPSIEVAGRSLALAGEAVQRKLVFDVYKIALYLSEPAPTAGAVVASDQVKRVQIRMLRDARREQVVAALKDGFASGNAGRVAAALSSRLDRLLAAVPDVRKGDELLITYVPGQGTTLQTRGGARMLVEGKDFADAMLKVWLGSDPGTRKLQRALLGRDS